MKSRAIKLLSLMLALVLCLAAFASCAKDGDETTETGTDSAADTVSTEQGERYDANGYLMDDLPETADYGDLVLTCYLWGEQKQWDFVDTSAYPTALLDQALYKREINIEERFNVQIEVVTQNGNWDNRSSFIQTLANSVNVNDQAYDIVGQYTACVGIGVSQGLYKDLLTVDNINTAKPWWPSHMVSSSTVGGKVFAMTGDISATLIRNVQCMFVNTDLYDSYNIAQYADGRSIYDVVRDYDWTLETLKTLSLDKVGSNDGVPDEQKMYGFAILNSTAPDGFLYAGGFKMVEDKDGKVQMSEDLSTLAFSNWYDAVHELFKGTRQDIYYTGSSGLSVFQTNRAIFYTGNVSESQTLAQKGVQFSILPMPMVDSDQGEYYTCGSLWVSMFSIPVDVKDQAMSGLFMEALASEAYRTVTGEVYYNIFQTRYNSGGNENSAEMFDIVSDSVVFATERMFADALKSFGVFRTAINDPQGNWTAVYSGGIDSWKGYITSLIATIG